MRRWKGKTVKGIRLTSTALEAHLNNLCKDIKDGKGILSSLRISKRKKCLTPGMSSIRLTKANRDKVARR